MLQKAELKFAKKVWERRESLKFPMPSQTKKLKVEWHFDGNFTVCVLRFKKRLFIGASKRNPLDRATPDIGADLSFKRALQVFWHFVVP